MRAVVMPIEQRDCPHCGSKESLVYFKESLGSFGVEQDMYQCKRCKLMTLWNGEDKLKVEIEQDPEEEQEELEDKE